MTTRYAPTCDHGALVGLCIRCPLESRIRELSDALADARRTRWVRSLVRGFAFGAGAIAAYWFVLGVDWIARAVIR